MSHEAKLIETLDGWELRRWEYDGAPLQAERRGATIEIEKGRLDIEHEVQLGHGYGTSTERVSLPVTVLRRLLTDYDARKASELHDAKGGTGNG